VEPEDSSGEITMLLQKVRAGEAHATERLIPLVMGELQRLARSYLRSERVGHTLQPTALVNEAYLHLVSGQERDWQTRAHFIGVTASIMRRVLVDHARRRRAAKRDGGVAVGLALEHYNARPGSEDEKLIALSDALDRLEKLSPRQRQVVEMRHFGGLSIQETAEALGVSDMTVKRDWIAARAWLKRELQPGGPA
jgi:RNA polymerase sigma-70 factor, ECF subfamily